MKIKLGFVTDVGMQFKSHWLLKRKIRLRVSKAEANLLAHGIKAVEPEEILRPALIEEPYEPLLENYNPPEEKPACYFLNNDFQPIANMEQAQLITNSLVFDSFPNGIAKKIQTPSEEDEEIALRMALHSHVLDAEQKKLHHDLKYPGYRPPRNYGIKPIRKISSLMHQMVAFLEHSHPEMEAKYLIEDAVTKITLKHSDKLVHMKHKSKFLLCSRMPLDPVFDLDQVKALEGSPMPDIYPLSPFIHSRSVTDYDTEDSYALPGGMMAPHTVCMAHTYVPFVTKEHQFYGMTLIYAFSHAAAYAKEINKDLSGDLEHPVSLNVIHTNGRLFHIGRFQLNTLNCTGATKNIFWHEPWIPFFDNIGFHNAKPFVEQLNARPLSLLRALY